MVKPKKDMELFKRRSTFVITRTKNTSSNPKSNSDTNTTDNKAQEKAVKNIQGVVNFTENLKSKEGRLKNAVGVLKNMDKHGIRVEVSAYASLLQCCLEHRALAEGKSVHNHMIKKCLNLDLFLRNKLVVMYAKCQSLGDAREVFDEMPRRNSVSWNTMIAAYANHGKPEEALKLFYDMKEHGVEPNTFIFASVLPACARVGSLDQTKKVHAEIRRRGFEDNVFIGSGLVDTYAKCGSLEDARKVFDEMPQRDAVSWNTMIAAYAKHGKPEEALNFFYDMKENGVEPNSFTFASVLPACAKLGLLEQTKRVHEEIRGRGFEDNVFVGSGLVDTYAKCGSLENAREVFDEMPRRNVVTWNSMIAAYAKYGKPEESLKLFYGMMENGVTPDRCSFASVLPVCAKMGSLDQTKKVHDEIRRRGFEDNVLVGSGLVDSYAKCESLEDARKAFDKMPQRDAVSWNSMIAAYAKHGKPEEALKLFYDMKENGVEPNSITFASVLPAFSKLGLLDQTKKVHEEIKIRRLEDNVFVGSGLVDTYAKCGSLEDARKVFDKLPERDAVSFNTMIAAYAKHGKPEEALKLFYHMKENGVEPDRITFAIVLPACAKLGLVDPTRRAHNEIRRRGFEDNVFVGNGLVHTYAKCGILSDACKVFHEMPQRNVVSWNNMIAAYAKHGNPEEALKFFYEMNENGVEPNSFTFVSVLPACAKLGLLDQTRRAHNEIRRRGFEDSVSVGNGLVHTYTKCGSLSDACKVFQEMPQRNVVSWNNMITAYAKHGNPEEALKLFYDMNANGVEPNSFTFASVLPACAKLGSLDQTKKVHEEIRRRGFEDDLFEDLKRSEEFYLVI